MFEKSVSDESSINGMHKYIKENDFYNALKEPRKMVEYLEPFTKRQDLIDIAIRINVQVNLYAGSVYSFLNRSLDMEKIIHSEGCFAMTEEFYGVTSGYKLGTTAELVNGQYVINTNDPLYKKKWISQGMYAKYAVVGATLIENNKSQGTHLFLVPMDLDGIQRIKMTDKTIAKYLDNAEITFTNVKIPVTNIMNYNFSVEKSLERIITGRILLGITCLQGFGHILDNIIDYCKKAKRSYSNEKSLYYTPKIKKVLTDAKHMCLYNGNIYRNFFEQDISEQMDVFKASALKCKLVDDVIDHICNVKMTIGSCTLLTGPTELNLDIFLLFKFTEGDTQILRNMIVYNSFKNTPFKLMRNPLNILLMCYLLLAVYLSLDKKYTWNKNYDIIHHFSKYVVDSLVQF